MTTTPDPMGTAATPTIRTLAPVREISRTTTRERIGDVQLDLIKTFGAKLIRTFDGEMIVQL
jgi:hypothetical protein